VPNSMTGIAYRAARLDEAAEILAVLIEVAPEIPVQVEPLEREEALYALIRNCARSGESWVAVDETNRIVGFLLAEPDEVRRHYAEHEMLELRHGGVVKSHRHRGIFISLIEKMLARMVPVTATISPGNQSGAVRLLEKLGFHSVSSPGGEQRLRWDPGASHGNRDS
jgi:ribosomal protein S18 acetylase RimI-like enzyme